MKLRPNHDEQSTDRHADDARLQGAADYDTAAAATTRTAEDRTPDLSAPGPDAGPDGPTKLRPKGMFAAVKRTFKQFSEDNVSDWAAALTYYGVLSIFPGLLVIVSLLGLLGSDGQKAVTDAVDELAPNQQLRDLVDTVLGQVQGTGKAGLAAIIGIVVAFWSASGYIAAFMRASNAIYDVPEGRPIWKTLPIRVGVTALVGVMLIASAAIVIFTGDLAQVVGDKIGLGEVAVTTWNIAKWPVLIALVSLMFAVLYWASPNAKTGGFRWVSPGGIFAVLLWVVASAAFAIYLANFANYNATYGTLGGVIAFLVWLWISNIAILLGAELDAELERGRAIAAGHSPDDEPFLQLRDDRKLKKGSEQGLSQG
ncbi:putative ribonuclease BN [Actinoplanes missouriensis 431]|uniref:Putative ribonuclease BN n=1 Tax=Actinoplanes missouriensis (strain ATCC 14538 / DSM 43046 / CBS 188.64 / JCM 3121 / NBRC 102363 / NCIMB 12654 / NRRL B-3342 / UNCC 431) TaxID=512565 RepID=I0H0B2_ACTM4|nr:YihY/virulence factor BrkB family protein [Actinoplanes missouriensis]BAL86449.1 putative ribonuclease BN [Actinoplanes missouriensis 431]